MTAPDPPDAPPVFAEPRTKRDATDYTIGCGQPPADKVNGRVCAGTGTEPSCQLCPHSPTYWRLTYKPITTEENRTA